jgi:hypothetical protein
MGEGWDRDSRRSTLYDICHNIILVHNIYQVIECAQTHVRNPKRTLQIAALCRLGCNMPCTAQQVKCHMRMVCDKLNPSQCRSAKPIKLFDKLILY